MSKAVLAIEMFENVQKRSRFRGVTCGKFTFERCYRAFYRFHPFDFARFPMEALWTYSNFTEKHVAKMCNKTKL